MADTRTVVLILSPRAAEAVEGALVDQRASMAPEFQAGDEDVIATGHLLEEVVDELRSQRADLPPLTAKEIGERMAQAGAEAVAL